MEQLLLHLIGDYLTQSHWMATNKTKEYYPAVLHALIYSGPFWLLTRHAPLPWCAFSFILWSHFLIDRYRLARFIVFAKNHLGSPLPRWSDCAATGYPSDTPQWLAVWLLIVADNTLHLCCNYAALRWM